MPTVYCYPVKLTIADLIRAISICSPVSSIYIWSENLVAESEVKDGGNWRPVPVLSIVFVRAVNTNWRPVPVPLNCFSCFDVDLKNTVVLKTDNLFSDTIRYKNVILGWKMLWKLFKSSSILDVNVCHLWLHFSHWPNDWSSYSRYIYIELTDAHRLRSAI